jgi:AraC-like DNA-binding protein
MNCTFMARHGTRPTIGGLEDFRRRLVLPAVGYREFDACPALANVVACTWQRTVAADGRQRVLPDGCVDLVWRDGALNVAGPDTGAWMSPVGPGAAIVGLRFRPGAAGSALGLPASELRDMRVALEDVWGRAALELADRLGEAPDAGAQRRILEEAIVERRAAMDEPDGLVLDATRALGRPRSRVRAVGDRLGLSDRQLLRRFRVAVGYGPKTLDRVLRFQRFLAGAGGVAGGDDSLARLAAELGYADQAHLTRECVRLSGLTPGALVQRAVLP